jgi:hypothetical protein
VEVGQARTSRKRGRDWEIAADPDFPEDPETDFDIEDFTDEQKAFGKKFQVPRTKDADVYQSAPTRKRRRVDATVSFHPEVFVRTEADIDEIRTTGEVWRRDLMEDKAFPSSILGVLQTAPLKINPIPKHEHEVLALKDFDGRLRPSRHCDHWGDDYEPGAWKASPDYENVDSNGNKFRKDWEGWEEYNDFREQEQDEMTQADWDQEMTDLEDHMNENGPPNETSESECGLSCEQLEADFADENELTSHDEHWAPMEDDEESFANGAQWVFMEDEDQSSPHVENWASMDEQLLLQSEVDNAISDNREEEPKKAPHIGISPHTARLSRASAAVSAAQKLATGLRAYSQMMTRY